MLINNQLSRGAHLLRLNAPHAVQSASLPFLLAAQRVDSPGRSLIGCCSVSVRQLVQDVDAVLHQVVRATCALSLEHGAVQIFAFFDGGSSHGFLVIASGVIDGDFSQVVIDVSSHS